MTRISLLLVDDDDAYRTVMAEELAGLGFAVRAIATGSAAVHEAATLAPQVVLLDMLLPDMNGVDVLRHIRATSPRSEVIMLTGQGSITSAVEAVQAGAADYVCKPCSIAELQLRVERALERQRLRERTTVLERALSTPDPGASFVGASPPFRALLAAIERAAPTDLPVLISGETGSGKGVVARLLHARSPRRSRPFVVVDCAGLREELLQSELFGHERGAFTGASAAKPGLFEVANGGTLFLDEIGDMKSATQAHLLRILDDSTFRHLGGTADIRVDVRVLAATHRDLDTLVREGTFREDLLYRLRAIAITTPSLRERPGDPQLLAAFYLNQLNARYGEGKALSEDAVQALVQYDWPGNVRQLRYVLESAYVMSGGPTILPGHLSIGRRPMVETPATGAAGDRVAGAGFSTLDELECAHIKRALQTSAGHRGRAAQMLGVSERSLYRLLTRHGIEG
jgi:DNA-binding NtrC family response regulator